MSYLYGDSTDSGLQINYIELLRDFLDFATQLLLSEHRISDARATVDTASQTMEAEVSRIQSLGDSVLKTLDSAKRPASQSATEQCISALEKATQDTLRRAVDGLKQELSQAEQDLVLGRKRERAANAKIIEYLLLNHELPDSHNAVDILANSDGTGHIAEVKGSNLQGLHWRFSAEIPAAHHFHTLGKVAALFPELTIELPEMSGFVRKSVKLKPYRVFPLYICNCTHDHKHNVSVQLRSSPQPGDDSGLDVTWSPKSGTVSIVRMHKGDTSPSYEVSSAEVQPLVDLCQTLRDESFSLVSERTKLLEILFNNKPLAECEAPTELIKRLISRLGPVISGIVEHSLGDKELVLKRVLANGRREEIFAAKTELRDKIATVPVQMRGIFVPLGLGNLDFSQEEEVEIATVDIEVPSEQSVEIEVLEIEDQVALARTALPLTISPSQESPPDNQVYFNRKTQTITEGRIPKPEDDLDVLEPIAARPSGAQRTARASAPAPISPRQSAPLMSPVIPPRARRTGPPATLPSIVASSEGSATAVGSVQTKSEDTNIQTSATLVRDVPIEIEADEPSGPFRLPRLETAGPENEDSIDIALAGLEYDG